MQLTDSMTGADTRHCELCVRANPQLTPRLFTGLHDAAGNEICQLPRPKGRSL